MILKRTLWLSLLLFACSPERTGKAIATITVPQGQITLGFYADVAPLHTANFIKLAEDGFYNGTTFHRVEPALVQGGDPNSKDRSIYNDGFGTNGYTIPSEAHHRHSRGALAMAKKPLAQNPQNESSGCQFYIALDSLNYLDDENYTIFGYVIDGFDVLDSLSRLEWVDGKNPNSNWKNVTEMLVEVEYEQLVK